MEQTPIGIGDLQISIPPPRITLESMIEHRIREFPELERRLRRSVDKTGQAAVRFPEPWQDSATIAAQASYELLLRNATAVPSIRYLGAGTETTVDQSKPMAAYVEGMLQSAGIDIPERMMTFQAQHACAGGTIALMGIAGLLSMTDRDERGLVVSSDIARYDAPSTAEITQGAGAVSLLVEKNPRLLEIDFATAGYCSRDVDDFFRPNGSVVAKVKGGYSMQCYNESLDVAFHDHCERVGKAPEAAITSTDMFVFHVPFKLMALGALQRLVSHHTALHGADLDRFLSERGFEASLEPNTLVGNIYTASTFLALAFLLRERYDRFGDDIVGKSMLMASYGSGNTMIVLSCRIAEGAPQVIRSWDLDRIFQTGYDAPLGQYLTWLEAPHSATRLDELYTANDVPRGTFYLSGIREDGYRLYAFQRS